MSWRPKLPPHPIALRDGFAVEAAAIADASPYAPLPFASPPRRIDAGEPLPAGTDAVAPLDAVMLRGDRAEAIAAVAPGEGVLPAGGDATPRTPLRRAGERSARARYRRHGGGRRYGGDRPLAAHPHCLRQRDGDARHRGGARRC